LLILKVTILIQKSACGRPIKAPEVVGQHKRFGW